MSEAVLDLPLSITINGVQLTEGQAAVIRIAVGMFDPNCGDDEFSRDMARAFTERLQEVNQLMWHKKKA